MTGAPDTRHTHPVGPGRYLRVHEKFSKVLIPDILPGEARAAGEEDWEADAGGAERMSQCHS